LKIRYDQSLGETAVPVFAVSRAAAANILGIKIAELKTIENLTALKKDTTAKVKVNFPDLSPTVTFKTNLVKKQSDAYNVVGVLEGGDPVLKNEAIVIGAHYDHLGRGGQSSLAANSTEIHRGADDNASGTAALLEIARRFAKEKNNKRTIVFIAFGGEEEGLLGSKHYVNNPVFPLDKTVAMLNMDMIGRLTENKLTVGGIGTATEWKGLVERLNPAANIRSALDAEAIKKVDVKDDSGTLTLSGAVDKTDKTNARTANTTNNNSVPSFNLQLSEEGFGPSDHSSFYGKQIPVLFFFTGTHPDYHKPADTADKINYAGLANITNYVARIARAIDQNAAPPAYKVAQSSGQGARAQFNVTIGVVPGYGDANDGMLLDGVRDGSPAAAAGLKAGDRVVKFAGKEIRNVQDYTFVLGELKADTEYEIEIVRAGQRLTLKVKPAARR
jgi:Zn-dependent M28 family amino/carboxypeptidase